MQQDRETFFFTLINTIPDLVWLKNPHGIYLSCNKKFERFIGAKEKDIVGKTDYDLLDKSLADFFTEHDKAAIASGESLINEEEITYADDGHNELIETIKTPMYDAKGTLVGVLGIARDITNRKEIEGALKVSEERFKILLEVFNFGIWDWNLKNDTWYTSPTYYTMLGYDPVSGPSERDVWIKRIHPEDREMVAEKINNVLINRNDYYEYEARIIDAQSRYRWHLVVGHVVERDGDGKPNRLIGLRIDITERKEEELALIARRKELEVLHRISETAFKEQSLSDTLGKIVQDISSALNFPHIFIEYHHRDTDEMELAAFTGSPAPYGGIKEMIPLSRAISQRTVMTGKPQLIKDLTTSTEPAFLPLLKKDTLSFISIPILIEEEIYGTLSMAGMEKIEHHEEMIQLAESLANLIASIISRRIDTEEKKKLTDQLQNAQKVEAIGRLAGGIAHDFNNILSGILGLTNLAQLHITDQKKLENYLDNIKKGAQRAAILIQQILACSRQEEDRKGPTSISMIIREATKLLRSTIPVTIDIEIHLESDSIIFAEPTQIHQVIMNLCTNAYYAMKETGGILIIKLNDIDITDPEHFPGITIEPGRYQQLTIIDSGKGIDKEIIDKIFDPYFTTKEMGEGTGLGLAVVQSIVANHNGYISVTSTPGKGATFQILFPLVEIAIDLQESNTSPRATGGNERIMIVDDEEIICAVTGEILQYNGYDTTTFINSEEALDAFMREPLAYDLIITDMTMPRMSGATLAKKILEIREEIPVILRSGYNDTITEAKALEIGIKKYLQKPVDKEILLHTLRDIFDENLDNRSVEIVEDR